ncbi:hypothetical protein SAMN02745134_01594 [Clostridium acidisoli DSM 12555]|uniref:Uncharacterized protein n=1 Tax=Clostridium acidisoli DSM 12555 TaxID=1121291 RepID=A0A1W1XEA2_9CLOT|nr:hypothetical protein [Clostridium acidisoli]SMC22217.1 hypothetical protein SAMN02745134_01594 [Clostridium acidisoli DSM 12555]
MRIIRSLINPKLVLMSCTCSLTGLAHIINITVTKKLIADYLAWGFFMGLAFLSVGVAINHDNKQNSMMKIIVIVCGTLYLIGFLGTVFINENIWYLAPFGYGLGTILICIKMMKIEKE